MAYNIESVISELKSLRIGLPKQQTLPDDYVLDAYERKIGFKFNEDYRKFLKEAGDSFYKGKAALRVTALEDSPRELSVALTEARLMGLPLEWLPVCEDNGDYYCIVPGDEIRFWSHNGASNESWQDLATWIKEVWIEGN